MKQANGQMPAESQCIANSTDADCPDNCEACASGEWERLCDDCRFYAAQDAA